MSELLVFKVVCGGTAWRCEYSTYYEVPKTEWIGPHPPRKVEITDFSGYIQVTNNQQSQVFNDIVHGTLNGKTLQPIDCTENVDCTIYFYSDY